MLSNYICVGGFILQVNPALYIAEERLGGMKKGYQCGFDKFCNFDKIFIMEAITIEILNPKAKQLIKDLADMKLINISKSNNRIADFKKILTKLRSNSDSIPSLDEINKEVELVRTKRYAIKS